MNASMNDEKNDKLAVASAFDVWGSEQWVISTVWCPDKIHKTNIYSARPEFWYMIAYTN